MSVRDTLRDGASYAGATADSKHPRSTLTVISDPKFLQTQFIATQMPHKITISLSAFSLLKLDRENYHSTPSTWQSAVFASDILLVFQRLGM